MRISSYEHEHEHEFGPGEYSRFAGMYHRKCQVAGCKAVSLDFDDSPDDPRIERLSEGGDYGD